MYSAWKVDIAIPATSWLTLPFGSFLAVAPSTRWGPQPVVNGVYNPYKYHGPTTTPSKLPPPEIGVQ